MKNNRPNNFEELPIQLWAVFISDCPSKWRHTFESAFKIDDEQKDILLHKKHQLFHVNCARIYREYDFIININEEKDKTQFEATLNYIDNKSGKPKVYKLIRDYNRPGVVTEAKIASSLKRLAEFGISNAVAWSKK